MPLISVIIPTHNRAEILPQAIDSVINQFTTDWELIIVDDGSEDNTKEVVEGYLADIRLHYIYQENKGVSAARNAGVRIAKGEYIIFLDSDDYVRPQWLKEFTSVIMKGDSIDCVVCGFVTIQNQVMEERLPSLLGYNPTLSGTFLIKTNLFQRLGGYDTNLVYGENTELFFRIKEASIKIRYLRKADLYYNKATNIGSLNVENKVESLKYILIKYQGRLDSKTTFLYLQIIGVGLMKLGKGKEAKKYLKQALWIRPWSIKTGVRYFISLVPYLREKVYL